MRFPPELVVALATYLAESASASPFLSPRQAQVGGALNVTDPHAAPPVPAGFMTPISTGGIAWTDAYGKAKGLVDQMTLEEKVNITSGFPGACVGNTGAVERLGIKPICFADGPVGPRPVVGVTQFPAGVTVAATWDHDLIYARSHAMGQEFKGKGVNLALTPVTGGPLGRSPLNGRNWEGFAPDVYLNGVASKLSVQGVQDAGVQACAKHFIAYEQQSWRTLYRTNRLGNLTQLYQQVDSIVDDKTLHELYGPGFAEATRAGVASVMCAYNSVNGEHACESSSLQNDFLKGELGFAGYVVSDWGGTWSTDKSAAYGLDSCMPGTGLGGQLGAFFGEELVDAATIGTVSEARLDDMAIRILTPYYHLGQDKDDFPATNFDASSLAKQGPYATNENVNVQADHWKLVKQIGEESATLLKNARNSSLGLPIKSSDDVMMRIAVFGDDAAPPEHGLTGCGPSNSCYDNPGGPSILIGGSTAAAPRVLNGTVTVGSGSGAGIAPYVISPLEGIVDRSRHSNIVVDWNLATQEIHFPYITNVASLADKCIVFASAFQAEGADRQDLKLAHNSDGVINEVARSCADTIVVVHSGQTVDMEGWIDNENVTAVVWAYYAGQEQGASIASVLFGDVVPSGKLPFTIGKSIDDYPGGARGVIKDDVFTPIANFSEGLFIDYKWFDAQEIEPRFPFGFGLSYSSFEYSAATVESTPKADDDYVQLTNEKLDREGSLYDLLYTVGVTVQNTGDMDAAEVAQMYMTWPSSVTDQPIRNLRGFCKEKYAAGESQTLTFPVRAKDLAVWDVDRQTWTIPSGEYTFAVGRDSRDLPVKATITV